MTERSSASSMSPHELAETCAEAVFAVQRGMERLEVFLNLPSDPVAEAERPLHFDVTAAARLVRGVSKSVVFASAGTDGAQLHEVFEVVSALRPLVVAVGDVVALVGRVCGAEAGLGSGSTTRLAHAVGGVAAVLSEVVDELEAVEALAVKRLQG